MTIQQTEMTKMNDQTPDSKVTAAALAGVMISVVATVANIAGYDLNLNPELALWIATGVLTVVGYFTRQRKVAPSLVESIQDGKVDAGAVDRLKRAIDSATR